MGASLESYVVGMNVNAGFQKKRGRSGWQQKKNHIKRIKGSTVEIIFILSIPLSYFLFAVILLGPAYLSLFPKAVDTEPRSEILGKLGVHCVWNVMFMDQLILDFDPAVFVVFQYGRFTWAVQQTNAGPASLWIFLRGTR